MKPWQIKLGDWQRILFGDAPPEFMLEVVLRTLAVYLCMLLVVRWLGKRMSGQLTLTEMAVMLTLGAIVSVPMQTPDRGISQGILILVCALLFQRGTSYWGSKDEKFEKLSQGKLSLMVKDGVMDIGEMEKARISRQQLYAELRSHNIRQLGEVERVYLEAGGFFSTFKFSEPRPGMLIFPEKDCVWSEQEVKKQDSLKTCRSCGFTTAKAIDTCTNCKANDWTYALMIS